MAACFCIHSAAFVLLQPCVLKIQIPREFVQTKLSLELKRAAPEAATSAPLEHMHTNAHTKRRWSVYALGVSFVCVFFCSVSFDSFHSPELQILPFWCHRSRTKQNTIIIARITNTVQRAQWGSKLMGALNACALEFLGDVSRLYLHNSTTANLCTLRQAKGTTAQRQWGNEIYLQIANLQS